MLSLADNGRWEGFGCHIIYSAGFTEIHPATFDACGTLISGQTLPLGNQQLHSQSCLITLYGVLSPLFPIHPH